MLNRHFLADTVSWNNTLCSYHVDPSLFQQRSLILFREHFQEAGAMLCPVCENLYCPRAAGKVDVPLDVVLEQLFIGLLLMKQRRRVQCLLPVSYTHLTLPMNREV